jgi:hypothetical protein
MEQDPDTPSRVQHGVWYPPRPLWSNRLVPGDTTGLTFYFDGQRVSQVQSLPTEGQIPILFQELSAYFHNNNFWCVPYNAVTIPVGSGRQGDTDSEDDDSEADEDDTYTQNGVDWHCMQFNHDTTNYISFASVPGEYDELITQRVDQRWVWELLPDKYHADPSRWTPDQQYGGMNGPLALLLALLAFSVPADYVQRAVEHCVRGDHWRHSGRPRGRGCKYCRTYYEASCQTLTRPQGETSAVSSFGCGVGQTPLVHRPTLMHTSRED